ncbi:MAG: hypothetical protein H7A39_04650 [Chlamydiales bacterium]|nr:hypothetical protein [Chlamydiales bacterium]
MSGIPPDDVKGLLLSFFRTAGEREIADYLSDKHQLSVPKIKTQNLFHCFDLDPRMIPLDTRLITIENPLFEKVGNDFKSLWLGLNDSENSLYNLILDSTDLRTMLVEFGSGEVPQDIREKAAENLQFALLRNKIIKIWICQNEKYDFFDITFEGGQVASSLNRTGKGIRGRCTIL